MMNVTLMGYIRFLVMFLLRSWFGFLPPVTIGSRVFLVGVSESGFYFFKCFIHFSIDN